MILANISDEQKKLRKKEILMNGEVFRRVNQYPNYYVSDKGTVLSTVGQWKILKGTGRGPQHMVTKYNGTKSNFSSTRLCAMAFGGR